MTRQFEKDKYLFRYVIESGYYHLEILEDNKTYLGFSWDLKSKTQYFVFNVNHALRECRLVVIVPN